MNEQPNTTVREHVAQPLVLSEDTAEEERLDAVRSLMMNGYGPILDACFDNLPLYHQREAFVVESAHFLVYYLAVRLCDERGQTPEFKHLMQCFRKLHRTMESTVMQRFIELQGAFRAEAEA